MYIKNLTARISRATGNFATKTHVEAFHITLQMFASRVQPGLQILSAANFVCNLCNRYLKLLQLFASAVLWCKDSCKYLQSLQIKVAYLTTKVSCNHWLQQLHPECNWTRNTSKSCSFGNQNIYSAVFLGCKKWLLKTHETSFAWWGKLSI